MNISIVPPTHFLFHCKNKSNKLLLLLVHTAVGAQLCSQVAGNKLIRRSITVHNSALISCSKIKCSIVHRNWMELIRSPMLSFPTSETCGWTRQYAHISLVHTPHVPHPPAHLADFAHCSLVLGHVASPTEWAFLLSLPSDVRKRGAELKGTCTSASYNPCRHACTPIHLTVAYMYMWQCVASPVYWLVAGTTDGERIVLVILQLVAISGVLVTCLQDLADLHTRQQYSEVQNAQVGNKYM